MAISIKTEHQPTIINPTHRNINESLYPKKSKKMFTTDLFKIPPRPRNPNAHQKENVYKPISYSTFIQWNPTQK